MKSNMKVRQTCVVRGDIVRAVVIVLIPGVVLAATRGCVS